MYSLEELKKLGLKWRQRFSEIEFVGEIEVDESDMRRLCPSLGKYLEDNTHDENFRSAMTVAVVNLAHYYQPDAFEGFRAQALDEFGHPDKDMVFWQREIGGPVLSVLVEYFGEANAVGPWRFVTPIMRQAGVPSTQVGNLAEFLRYLIQHYGWHFSEEQVRQALYSFLLPSKALSHFLESSTGWRYCRDLARLLGHHWNGLITPETSPPTQGFRGHILNHLLQSNGVAEQVARTDYILRPRLVLDLDHQELAIEFSPKGLNGPYRWKDDRQIAVSRYFLKAPDFERGVAGWTRQTDGNTEYWSVKPWHPAENPWAVFRSSNGVFLQASGSLPPGEYILVLPDDTADTLSEEMKKGDYGTLFLPVEDDRQLRILDCTLPPGFQIPEIGLCVEQALSRFPELRFAQSAQTLRHASQVFIGRLPEIEIANWSEDFARKYLVIVECAGQSSLIDCSQFERIKLDVPNPSQGTIRIESRGRTPRGFMNPELSFTLLPSARIDFPEGLLKANDQPIVAFHPADCFKVTWQQNNVRQIAEGKWQLSAGIDFIDGEATYQNLVRFSLSLPLHRLRIKGEALFEQILWYECLRQRSSLFLSLSDQECGQRIELLVEVSSDFKTVIELGPVPRNRQLKFSTDDVRDAFDQSGIVAGRLAVRRKNGACITRSEITFLHDEQIKELIVESDGTPQDFQERIVCASEPLQGFLKQLRNLREEPQPFIQPPSLRLPPSFQSFVSELQTCAAVFDANDGTTTVNGLTNENLRCVLEWYLEAQILIREEDGSKLEHAGKLLRCAPYDLSPLPFERWRKKIEELRERLKALTEYACLIREWNKHCRNNHWQAALQSPLAQLMGGTHMTEAARDYYDATEFRLSGDDSAATNYFHGANAKLNCACNEASSGPVWEVAAVLQAMVFYHMRHDQFPSQVAHLQRKLGRQWQRLRITLAVLCGLSASEDRFTESLSLSDISPHPNDQELEERS